jgi:hypothetical protein
LDDRLEVDGNVAPPEERKEPRLGLATTEQMLEEIATRMEVCQDSLAGRAFGTECRMALQVLPDQVLAYSTCNEVPHYFEDKNHLYHRERDS